MSFGTRLVLWGAAAVAGHAVLHADPAGPARPELTRAAVRQFDHGADAAEELRHATAVHNGTLLLWPAGLVVLAGLLFWDDVARLGRPAK